MEDLGFLVCFDLHRMSGLWGVVMAPSAEAIIEAYPELVIVDAPPRWISADELARMYSEPLWLDADPPQGLLRVVLDTRSHP